MKTLYWFWNINTSQLWIYHISEISIYLIVQSTRVTTGYGELSHFGDKVDNSPIKKKIRNVCSLGIYDQGDIYGYGDVWDSEFYSGIYFVLSLLFRLFWSFSSLTCYCAPNDPPVRQIFAVRFFAVVLVLILSWCALLHLCDWCVVEFLDIGRAVLHLHSFY